MSRGLTVVIPNFNGKHVLPRCLSALRAQSVQPDAVIVIDNGSQDGSAEQAETDHPGVQVVRRGFNSGFGGAANVGVELARTELVSVLNSDARPEPRWVETVTAFHEEGAWAWGGLLLSPSGLLESGGDCFSPFGFAYKHAQGASVDRLPPDPWEVLAPPGAAPVFVREVFRQLGGYDERYFLYLEDIDLAIRARSRGHRAFVLPGTAVEHDLGASSTNAVATWHIARNSLWCSVSHLPQLSLRRLGVTTRREWRDARARGSGRAYARGRVAAVKDLPRLMGVRRTERRERLVTDVELLRSFGLPGALS